MPRTSALDAHASLVGTMPDSVLAAQLGMVAESIRIYRVKHNIPSFSKASTASVKAPVTPVKGAKKGKTVVAATTPAPTPKGGIPETAKVSKEEASPTVTSAPPKEGPIPARLAARIERLRATGDQILPQLPKFAYRVSVGSVMDSNPWSFAVVATSILDAAVQTATKDMGTIISITLVGEVR